MASNTQPHAMADAWAAGSAYEPYVGRWSLAVAREFLKWLDIPDQGEWLDIGCGTGALCQAIMEQTSPLRIVGIDSSERYVEYVRKRVLDDRAHFAVADAQELPDGPGCYDAVVSGLVLNFIPKAEQAVREMVRVAKQGGTVAAYVWDYAGKMQFMRHFWNAAAALDPRATHLDEGRRFPLCNPDALRELFRFSGLTAPEVRAIDIATNFKDFDDFWLPFLGGQGPAPTYTMSLSEEQRLALRERLRNDLPFAVDGSIPLVARAWAVRGVLAL